MTAWDWLRLVMESPEQAAHPSDIAVAAAIASHLNRSGQAWPSIETLTSETRLSRKAVFHALTDLENAGLLAITRQPGRGNRYSVAGADRQREPAASLRRNSAEESPRDVAAEPPRDPADERRRGNDRSPQVTGHLKGPVPDRSPQYTRTENGPALEQKQPQLAKPPPAARTKSARTRLEPDLLAAILELRGADSGTASVVRDLARHLPEGAFRNALEATREADAHDRIETTPVEYFVGTLQRFERNGQYRS